MRRDSVRLERISMATMQGGRRPRGGWVAIALASMLFATGLGFGAGAASAQSQPDPNQPQIPTNPMIFNPIFNNPRPPAPYIAPKPGQPPPSPPLGFDGARLVISQDIWGKFAQYLQNDATMGFALFLVTYDGEKFDVVDCADYACEISPISQQSAIDQCQDTYKPQRCIIFAEGRHIKYAYQVVR
jgi:hypothetical protein